MDTKAMTPAMLEPADYQKRPVVIQAMQWDGTPESANAIEEWSDGKVERDDVHLEVKTLEGVMRANPMDWIIRGVQGEFYPCRDDIFTQTYVHAD